MTFLTVAGNSLATQEAQPQWADRIVLVQFKPGVPSGRMAEIARAQSLVADRILPRLNVRRFRILSGVSPLAMARALAQIPEVKFAEPDYLRQASYTPNDPRFALQWDMQKIRMPNAWDLTKGSSTIVTAVIDTGVDLDHPDLQSRLWVNSDEIANNGIDDDKNGYVDDVYGYDFAGDGIFPLPAAEDSNPDDIFVGHGTHVSGTIAATQDNGIGISGVAPGTRLMAVRALGGALGTGYSSDLSEALIYAADNGARVINMSLGGTALSLTEYNAMKYAWDRNVFIAAAAGNSGDGNNPLEYPAAYCFSMGVGATDANDAIASFSSYNVYVEASAPGVEILSTVPGGTYESTSWSGTSMATPHVAGLAALVLSKNPKLANWEVRAMIQDGAIDLGSSGWDVFYGYGRIDALNTLTRPSLNASQIRILTPPQGGIFPAKALLAMLWNPVPGAVSYRLNCQLPSGALKVLTTTDTYYTVHPRTTVAPGLYIVTVEAIGATGGMIASSGVGFIQN